MLGCRGLVDGVVTSWQLEDRNDERERGAEGVAGRSVRRGGVKALMNHK